VGCGVCYIVILMHPAWLQKGQSNLVMTVFRTSFTTFFEDLRFPILPCLPCGEWFQRTEASDQPSCVLPIFHRSHPSPRQRATQIGKGLRPVANQWSPSCLRTSPRGFVELSRNQPSAELC